MWVKLLKLKFAFKLYMTFSVSDEINYWTRGDFHKQFWYKGYSNTDKSPRAFVKDTQWSKICPTVELTWQAKHRVESPLVVSVYA